MSNQLHCNTNQVQVRLLPAERLIGSATVASACCTTCCCCCCCLHSVGSVMGAIKGSRSARIHDITTAASVIAIYWVTLILITIMLDIFLILFAGISLALSSLITLIFLPLVQLIVSGLIFLFSPICLPEVSFRTLKIITWEALKGTIYGILIMILLAILLSSLNLRF